MAVLATVSTDCYNITHHVLLIWQVTVHQVYATVVNTTEPVQK